jgi:hypothetical protein
VAYLGNDLQVAFPVYRNIDDISGSFNSSTTSFPLRVSGVAPVPAPLYSQQCLISVGGVVQRPDDSGSEGFRLSGGNIIFASAPTTGADFFGVILAGADYVNAGGNFPSGTASVPSITFNDDLDTGIYNSGTNQLSITTGGSERLRIDSAGQIESVSLGTAAAPAFSFTTDPNTGIYSPGADQLAISTNGTGRLFVNSSGNIGFGIASPSSLGTNITTVEIQGKATGRGGGVRLSTSDSSQKAAFYIYEGECIFGTETAHPLAFYINNSERMRLDSSGRLGLGTSSPGSLLDLVGGDIRLNSVYGINKSNADGYIHLSGGTSNALGGTIFCFGQSHAGNANEIHFRNSGNQTRVVIDSSGRLGVNTITPTQSLSIGGSGATLAGTAAISLFDGNSGASRRWSISNGAGGNAIDLFGKLVIGYSSTVSSDPMTGTAAVVIDSSGRVGVGSTTPAAKLHVEGDSFFTDWIYAGNSKGISSDSASRPLLFALNGSEKARLDTSGRLLVGTSSSSAEAIFIVQGGTTASGGAMNIQRSVTTASAGSTIGFISFTNSSNNVGATISADGDGTWSAGTSHPTLLKFSTTADGASSPTERMRITNTGNIRIGQTTTDTPGNGNTTTGIGMEPANGALFLSRANGACNLFINSNQSTGTADAINFRRSNVAVGSISTTTTATAYNTSSDYRLKENVVAVTDGITRLQQLKPSRFNFIADPTKTVDGFLAHEAAEVVPECITGEKDAVDADGKPIYQGIDQSKLVPLLTAALQEAVAKIESLEAKVAALESA